MKSELEKSEQAFLCKKRGKKVIFTKKNALKTSICLVFL